MKKLIIKILFRLIKIPIASEHIEHSKMNEWLYQQYPLPQFQAYIKTRNLRLLQVLGEGIAHNDEYWINVGQRLELGRLLSEAKREFEKAESIKEKKSNENIKSKKT